MGTMIQSRHGSKNGKLFPGELLRSLKQILQNTFKEKLTNLTLKIDGCNFGNELVLQAQIENQNSLKKIIELSIDNKAEEPIEKKIHILLDVLGHFLGKSLTLVSGIANSGKTNKVDKKAKAANTNWEEVIMGGVTLYVRQVG